jgi:hypothetical protein
VVLHPISFTIDNERNGSNVVSGSWTVGSLNWWPFSSKITNKLCPVIANDTSCGTVNYERKSIKFKEKDNLAPSWISEVARETDDNLEGILQEATACLWIRRAAENSSLEKITTIPMNAKIWQNALSGGTLATAAK